MKVISAIIFRHYIRRFRRHHFPASRATIVPLGSLKSLLTPALLFLVPFGNQSRFFTYFQNAVSRQTCVWSQKDYLKEPKVVNIHYKTTRDRLNTLDTSCVFFKHFWFQLGPKLISRFKSLSGVFFVFCRQWILVGFAYLYWGTLLSDFLWLG